MPLRFKGHLTMSREATVSAVVVEGLALRGTLDRVEEGDEFSGCRGRVWSYQPIEDLGECGAAEAIFTGAEVEEE